jgi:hypothetical protein
MELVFSQGLSKPLKNSANLNHRLSQLFDERQWNDLRSMRVQWRRFEGRLEQSNPRWRAPQHNVYGRLGSTTDEQRVRWRNCIKERDSSKWCHEWEQYSMGYKIFVTFPTVRRRFRVEFSNFSTHASRDNKASLFPVSDTICFARAMSRISIFQRERSPSNFARNFCFAVCDQQARRGSVENRICVLEGEVETCA